MSNFQDGILHCPQVTAYVEGASVLRQGTVIRIRNLFRKTLAGFEERMVFGMPCYLWHGKVEAAFANQKQAIVIYTVREGGIERFRHEIKGAAFSKGRFGYANPEAVDFEKLEQFLKAIHADVLREKGD